MYAELVLSVWVSKFKELLSLLHKTDSFKTHALNRVEKFLLLQVIIFTRSLEEARLF